MCEEKYTSVKESANPSLFAVRVEFNSIYCGRHLSDVKIPDKCVVLGFLRNGEVIPTSENPWVEIGDYILAMVLHPMMVPELKFVLKKACPTYYSLIECSLKYSENQRYY